MIRFTFHEEDMKLRAILRKSGEWWIGWLVDLPGVNAQEKTRNDRYPQSKDNFFEDKNPQHPRHQTKEMKSVTTSGTSIYLNRLN